MQCRLYLCFRARGPWPFVAPHVGTPPPPQRAIDVHQTTSHFHRRCGQIMIGTADRRASTAVGGEGLPLGRLRSDPRPRVETKRGASRTAPPLLPVSVWPVTQGRCSAVPYGSGSFVIRPNGCV